MSRETILMVMKRIQNVFRDAHDWVKGRFVVESQSPVLLFSAKI